jgi:hypothetical protein
MKSASLNLLEPTGPVQACNGVALLNIASDQATFIKAKHSCRACRCDLAVDNCYTEHNLSASLLYVKF